MVHCEDGCPCPEVPETKGVVIRAGEDQVTAGRTRENTVYIVLWRSQGKGGEKGLRVLHHPTGFLEELLFSCIQVYST